MREIWLSLGIWMIFGLPSGENSRRERSAHAGEKPAVQQTQQPRQSRTAATQAPAAAAVIPVQPAPAARTDGAEPQTAAPEPDSCAARPAGQRGHAEVRYGPSMPVPKQDYQ